jgi:uncharacterized membrane protein
MDIIAYNFSWMGFNTFLAVIPFALGWLFYLTQNRYFKIFYALVWILFLPNTVYLFTDLLNLIRQWGAVNLFEKLVLIFQYSTLTLIGLVTSVLSLYPLEKFLKETNSRINKTGSVDHVLIVVNFVVGFAITLGRVERVNSWDVVSRPESVIGAVFSVLTSMELIVLTMLFALLANFVYFLFRKPLVKYLNIYLGLTDGQKL